MKGEQPMKYMCANSRFWTNTSKGFAHGTSSTRGSVFKDPLTTNEEGGTLWLEHVVDFDGREYYWLMWYDKHGNPTISQSSVFNIKEIAIMAEKFIKLAKPLEPIRES